MKYPYIVNKNGIWYPSGTEVPDGAEAVENKKEDDFAQYMNEPVESGEETYTKTEINRMSTADLRKLAKDKEISGADEMTGAELKKVLIEKLGL